MQWQLCGEIRHCALESVAKDFSDSWLRWLVTFVKVAQLVPGGSARTPTPKSFLVLVFQLPYMFRSCQASFLLLTLYFKRSHAALVENLKAKCSILFLKSHQNITNRNLLSILHHHQLCGAETDEDPRKVGSQLMLVIYNNNNNLRTRTLNYKGPSSPAPVKEAGWRMEYLAPQPEK